MQTSFVIRDLLAEDQRELDDLKVSNGKGRTIQFMEACAVKVLQS